MKFNLKRLISFLLPALLAASCFSVGVPEGKAEIASDVEQLRVRADIPEGEESITDSVVIYSNQSWGLNFIDPQGEPADWIGTDVSEHLNLSGEMDSTVVRLTFDYNRMTVERLAQMKITSADCDKSISIVQAAADRFVMVEEKTILLPPEATEYTVSVISNIPWEAVLAKGATADVTFDGAAGNGDGTFVVSFGANDDPFSEKTASITISAEDSQDINLTFTQRRNAKFVIDVDFTSLPFNEEIQTASHKVGLSEETTYTLQRYGNTYSFVFGVNAVLQYRPADACILLDKGYIGLPVVAGMKLTQVSLKSVATNKKYLITSAAGSSPVVEGGESQTIAKDETATWELTGTTTDTRYYIYINSGSSRIAHITLTYE